MASKWSFSRAVGRFSYTYLPHQESRLNVQGDFRHDPESTQVHDGPEECVAVLLARERQDVPAGRDEFQGRDRRRQVAVLDARPVGRGGAGAGDGDVRQRGEVVQREALLVEIGAQLAVAHAGFERHRARLGVQRDHMIHRLERDEGPGAVGDVVEAMTRAEHFQRIVFLDELPDLVRPR